MKTHSTAQYLKWALFVAVMVGSFFVPMASQKAKAEGVARAGYTNGFNELFTTGAVNWTIITGKWTYDSGFLRGNGVVNSYSSVYFNKSTYSNLDYNVRLKRRGCSDCENSVNVRWQGNRYVKFAYANTGYYKIEKCGSSGCVSVVGWTASGVINKGGFNVLRVVAVGNTYQYYINNRLVSTKSFTGYSSGSVGISMWTSVAAGNILDIDYAILKKK